MIKDERQRRILELLAKSKSVKSADLSEMFEVSQETIRKDLEAMDEDGLLKRTFGGAMAIPGVSAGSPDVSDPSLEDRNITNLREKEDIGRFAASLIEPKDTIVLDSSTTTLKMVQYIPENYEITAITNALATINELVRKKGVTVISTGGYYRPQSTSFLGTMSLNNLDGFNINKAFMSGNAFSVEQGVMDPNEQEAEMKRRMIQKSRESILLIDSTKYARMAPITTCGLASFSTIVSDSKLPEPEVHRIEALGIKLFRV